MALKPSNSSNFEHLALKGLMIRLLAAREFTAYEDVLMTALTRWQVWLLLGHCWRNNLEQVVHTLVPLSPSSISWYRCKNREGNGRLWKKCGLSSITLSVSSLPAQDQEIEMSAVPRCRRAVRGRCWLWGNLIITQRRSVAKSVGCFQRRLFVCLSTR